MSKRRIVVTGLGVVSPVGSTVKAAWDAILRGESGIGPVTRFDVSAFPVRIGGSVRDFDVSQYISPKDARRMDDFMQYGVAAGVQAVNDSGLDFSKTDPTRCGAVCGAGIGGLGTIEAEYSEYLKAMNPRRISPLFVPASSEASRPWDLDPDGFVLSGGGGAMVREEGGHARSRGAGIYAEVVGFGMSGDAYHITAPPEDGEGARISVVKALKDASLNPTDVQYINAHATSTPLGDKAETVALKRAFGDQAKRLAVSSTKSMTGHLLGAAGVVEAIFSVLAIRDGVAPPTINYHTPDPECDLDFVPNTARRMKIDVSPSNSFGLRGTNGSLSFRPFSPQRRRPGGKPAPTRCPFRAGGRSFSATSWRRRSSRTSGSRARRSRGRPLRCARRARWCTSSRAGGCSRWRSPRPRMPWGASPPTRARRRALRTPPICCASGGSRKKTRARISRACDALRNTCGPATSTRRTSRVPGRWLSTMTGRRARRRRSTGGSARRIQRPSPRSPSGAARRS